MFFTAEEARTKVVAQLYSEFPVDIRELVERLFGGFDCSKSTTVYGRAWLPDTWMSDDIRNLIVELETYFNLLGYKKVVVQVRSFWEFYVSISI